MAVADGDECGVGDVPPGPKHAGGAGRMARGGGCARRACPAGPRLPARAGGGEGIGRQRAPLGSTPPRLPPPGSAAFRRMGRCRTEHGARRDRRTERTQQGATEVSFVHLVRTFKSFVFDFSTQRTRSTHERTKVTRAFGFGSGVAINRIRIKTAANAACAFSRPATAALLQILRSDFRVAASHSDRAHTCTFWFWRRKRADRERPRCPAILRWRLRMPAWAGSR